MARELTERGRDVEHLDGDRIRATESPMLGFGEADRKLHLRQLAERAASRAHDGAVVVVSAIAPYAASRRAARELVAGLFVEVHVAAPLEVCVQRDTKGLYARAIAGEIADFTGISAPYEEPLDPELRIDTSLETPAESAARVLGYLADAGI